tara:strand:+ start:7926 stop:8825 length:900 start_codon:yes stop_codon:yes gene_type:complete
MKRILLTGASGFLGSSLSSSLEKDNYKISKYASKKNLKKKIMGKDFSKEILSKNELRNIDVVIHAAGIAHNKIKKVNEKTYFEINSETPKKIYKESSKANVKKFIFISSIKADYKKSPFLKKSRDIYAESKLRAEYLLKNEAKKLNTELIILRPALVYGPNPKGNLKNLEHIIRYGLSWLIPEINNKKSLIHIDDFCDAVKFFIDKDSNDNTPIVLAEQKKYSTREILEHISNALDLKFSDKKISKFLFLKILKYIPFLKKKLYKLFESDNFSSEHLNNLGFKCKRSLKDYSRSKYYSR